MLIYNTLTGESDNVSNQQAQRVVDRTNGLWSFSKKEARPVISLPKKRRRRKST